MKQVESFVLAALAMAGFVVPAAIAQEAPSAAETPELGTGPYPAQIDNAAGFADHVVYRPANLASLGKNRLGVLVWGNGGCSADGASARRNLLEIASHGYLVIAPGKVLSGPGAVGRREPRRPDAAGGLPPVATTATDVGKGIDWALAEGRRKGSALFGRIDPRAIAVGGHSCGGLQALQLAADPRVRTVMVHNSGIFTDGTNPIRGLTVSKDLLKTLRTPVIYFLGGPSDIAHPNGTDDFKRIDHVPAVLLQSQVGHGGTFGKPHGGAVAAVSVDWLEWQLRGDRSAARTFTGVNCRLCTAADWTIERKGL